MATNLREQAARKILRTVRSQGHPYVELRENGKRFIYFCTLCLAPCYSDSALYDHLKGNLHKARLSTAKVTLLGPNPWPFNDGVLFFDTSTDENDKDPENTNHNQNRLLKFSDNDNNLAIVNFVEALQSDVHPSSTNDDNCSTLLIPHLLIGDETVDVKVREVGLGKIAARFRDEINNSFIGRIKRIWCEWLGNENNGQQDGVVVPDHDFAVVIFPYNYDLGRSGLLADIKSLLPPASVSEPENEGGSDRKRKTLLSNPKDISDSLSTQCDSNNVTSRVTVDQHDNRLLRTSKAERKELRRRQRLAAEKMCNICQQKMLAGKDVAAFLNLKTRRLACSSRNGTGAFHLFHTSCVIHWILLCEFHIIADRLTLPKVRQGPKKKVVANGKRIGKGNDTGAAKARIKSVFCPECQGSGIITDGNRLENPLLSLSEMFKLKIKACDACREWIKCPEVLQHCSTGFHFPSQSEEIVQEKVEPVKLLHFYRADVQGGA